jgi:hypothetical protein
MDKEILKPSEELENNVSTSSETSTDGTIIEVSVQEETPTPTEENALAAEEALVQDAVEETAEAIATTEVPTVEKEVLEALTAGEAVPEELTIEEGAVAEETATEESIADTPAIETSFIEEPTTEELAEEDDAVPTDTVVEELVEPAGEVIEETTEQEDTEPVEVTGSTGTVEEEVVEPTGEVTEETTEPEEVTGSTDTVEEEVVEPAGEVTEETAEQEDTEPEEVTVSTDVTADEELAEPAGKETTVPTVEIVPSKTPPAWDFASFSTEEIISHMKTLIENYPVSHLRILDTLPPLFEAQLQRERDQKLASFVATGNQAEHFDFPNDDKERFYSIYRLYREKRASFYKKSEEEKEENLKIKLQIIEELKELVQKEESLNKTFQEFRNLQERWRNTGMVPQVNLNDLLETYHLHVENFYNYIKINRELRDLDLKKNLDSKIALCEQAEQLIEDNNIGHAFRQLQQLHSQWKEVGPVPDEQKELIWDRFKEATGKINEAYHRFFDSLREEQENNLKIKEDICSRAATLATLTPQSLSEWGELTKQVLELQEEWKHSGTIPQKERNKLYKRFRNACDIFFNNKRAFYQKQQEEQENNLALKIALCEKVEAVQHSTEWRATTDKIIAYQREWKKIGPVPKKQSNKVWVRFRTACDFFFNSKTAYSKGIGTDQQYNLELKKALIEEVRNYVISENNEENIKALKSFQSRWSGIGFVPIKEKDSIQAEFRNLINTHFDQLDITEFDRNLERFKSKVHTFDSSGETKDFKIVQEREKLVTKIKQVEADLHVWENNIGFFSKSSNSEGLIKEFTAKIESARHKLTLMQEKLKVIDSMI